SPINYLLFVREKVVVLFKIKEKRNSQIMYHLMLLPGMIFLLIFSFVPMFGIIMAFMDYVPAKGIFGSDWVGFDNFKYMFQIPDSLKILNNTLIISAGKVIFGTLVPVIFALLLNEIRVHGLKDRFRPLCTYLISYLGLYYQQWLLIYLNIMDQ